MRKKNSNTDNNSKEEVKSEKKSLRKRFADAFSFRGEKKEKILKNDSNKILANNVSVDKPQDKKSNASDSTDEKKKPAKKKEKIKVPPYSKQIENKGKIFEEIVEPLCKFSMPILFVLSVVFAATGLGAILFGVMMCFFMVQQISSEGWKDMLKDLPKTDLEKIEQDAASEIQANKEKLVEQKKMAEYQKEKAQREQAEQQKMAELKKQQFEKEKAERVKIKNLKPFTTSNYKKVTAKPNDLNLVL